MKHLLIILIIFLLPQLSFAQCNYLQSLGNTNLVVNSDFSLGNTGFTSSYTYATGSLLLESTYTITTQASNVHFAFTGTDHTTGSGNLVVLNGSGTPSFVWNQSVSVLPNTYYNFSTWFKNIVKKPEYAGLPIASVELWINGVKISKNITLPDYPDQWVLLDTFWFSGSSTTANLAIKNIGISLNGNDFALDDVAFRKCCSVGTKTNKTICLGSGTNLNAMGSGSFSWAPITGLSNPSSLNPFASPTSNTNYVVTFTNGVCITRDTFFVSVTQVSSDAGIDEFICKRQPTLLNGSGIGNSFSWLPIKNIVNNLTPNPTVNPDSTTTYILTVTNGFCTSKDTMTVYVNPLEADLTADKNEFCIGDTIQLNGIINSPTATFSWSPISQIISGNTLKPKVIPQQDMWCYLTYSDGTCTSQDSIKLTLKKINVDAGLDSVICFGDSLQLQGMVDAWVNYKWLPSLGLNRDDILNPYSKPIADITYTLEAKEGNCTTTDSVWIQVKSLPIVDAGPDQRICMDAVTYLDGFVENFTSFIWTPAKGLSDVKLLNPEAIINATTDYILIGNNGKCVQSDTVRIIVNPKVIASFTPSSTASIAPANINFKNTSSNAWFYSWNFGDNLGVSNAKDANYIFNNIGKYTIWLIAKDSLGCIDSVSSNIQVVLNSYLEVPNAFTPNSDNLHDSFEIFYNSPSFSFVEYRIYDRWGEQLFSTKVPDGQWWDGTFQGKPCPSGVYFYILEAKTLFDKTYSKRGTVTLLR